MWKPLIWLGCAAAVVACGDNWAPHGASDARPVDAPPPDGLPPDASVCAPFDDGAPGGACATHVDCDTAAGGDGTCYVGALGPSVFAPEGYCTVDDGTGTVCEADGDCPSGSLCVTDTTYDYKFCAPACCAAETCPANQACWDSFNGFPLDRKACVPGNAEARDGDPCTGFYECHEYSQCLADFEYPGGSCQRYGCTPGDDSTCNGGVCIIDDEQPPFDLAICMPGCTSDADCRQVEGYRCYDPDPVSTTNPTYCRHPHVGDACATPEDCGGGTWECRTGLLFPNGYCTQSGCPTPGSTTQCTPGSICADHPDEADHYCADRCPGPAGTQSTCRRDYLCQETSPAPEPGVNTLGCLPIIL
jgi:hypothetical protein